MIGEFQLPKPMLQLRFTTEFNSETLVFVHAQKSILQKWSAVRLVMRSNIGFVFVLALMVLTPLSTMVDQPEEGGIDLEQNPTFTATEMSEGDRLELATEMWSSMPKASLVSAELTPASGIIHMAAGSFDPLLSDGPEVLSSFSRNYDASLTGMAMVQLHDGNRDAFDALTMDYDLTVLDFFHDEGWLVRLPSPPMDAFTLLENDDRIRWIGHQQPQWRIAPDLIEDGATSPSLTLIPASDLGFGGYPALATDLVRYGADEAWCDAWLCRALVSDEDGLTPVSYTHLTLPTKRIV